MLEHGQTIDRQIEISNTFQYSWNVLRMTNSEQNADTEITKQRKKLFENLVITYIKVN